LGRKWQKCDTARRATREEAVDEFHKKSLELKWGWGGVGGTSSFAGVPNDAARFPGHGATDGELLLQRAGPSS